MAKLGDLVVRIGADTRDLNKSLGKVQRNMRSMTSNFTKLGRSMTKAITLPLAAIGGLSLRTAVNFEASMAKVKAVSGATAKEFDLLTASAKELGRTTVFTASEVAGLQLEFAKLGFTAEQINEVTGATLNLAQATGSDLAQAAEVAGATLGGFGLAASETQRVTDVMAASFSSSALDINHFQESMKLVAPNAKAAGVSIEEATAMLAVLSKAGIKGSSAGTALRRILQEMQGTTGTLTERFAELNKKGLDLQGSMDEVGRRAGTSLLVLAEGAGEVEELTGAFINSRGAAQAMADVMNDNAMGAIKRMTSALEGAGISIGEILSPAFESIVKKITGVIDSFNGLSDKLKGNILVFGGLLAVLGPLLIMLPQIVVGIKLIGLAFSTSMPHILAATVAISAISLLFLDTSRAASDTTIEIKKVETALKDLNKAQLEIEAQVSPGAGAEQIAESMEFAALRVQEADEEIKRIQQAIADRGGFVGVGARKQLNEMEAYRNEFQRVINAAELLIKINEDADDDGIVKVVDRSQMKLLKALPTALIGLEQPLKTLQRSTTTVADEIVKDLQSIIDAGWEFADQINEAINTGVAAMIGGVALMVGAAIGAEKPLEGLGSFLGEMLAQMAINIGQYAIAHGTAIEAIKASLTSLSGIGAIVAGATLIALGAGLRSSIQKNAEAAGVPALAEGGLAYGPTLAMVGDNRGANVDPEVVAPLSKLKDMLGGNAIQVYGRISGDDIVISNNRASRDRNRF